MLLLLDTTPSSQLTLVCKTAWKKITYSSVAWRWNFLEAFCKTNQNRKTNLQASRRFQLLAKKCSCSHVSCKANFMFSIGQPLITLSNETHIFKNLIGFKKKTFHDLYLQVCCLREIPSSLIYLKNEQFFTWSLLTNC